MSDGGHEFLDDVAIADVAFRAWGTTLEDVLANAARATAEVMIEDPTTVRLLEHRGVSAHEATAEMLLFDLLEEIVYYKDTESLLLLPEAVHVGRDDDGWWLDATLAGEPIDPRRHAMSADVKAVTLHRFALYRDGDTWHAEVVLDI